MPQARHLLPARPLASRSSGRGRARGQQRTVAEVMPLHDGGVERGKVQGDDGLVVVARGRLEDRPAFVGLVGAAPSGRRREHVAVRAGLAQQHGEDLDALPAREQVLHGHAGDAGHLHVPEEQLQLVEEPQGQLRVAQGQRGEARRILPAEPLDRGGLQLDPGLVEEVEYHGRQGVGHELLLALEDRHDVEKQPPLHVDLFSLVLAELPCLEGAALHTRRDAHHAAQSEDGPPWSLTRLRSGDGSSEVRLQEVVANDDVGVRLDDVVAEVTKAGHFRGKREGLSSAKGPGVLAPLARAHHPGCHVARRRLPVDLQDCAARHHSRLGAGRPQV
mmetsp:Transcript_65331/g.202334  ORF Transcript_65331/g.202334 Transcript_65331/m.202334 type:complete len:332 (-) Transcript_65331:157-1152(-)